MSTQRILVHAMVQTAFKVIMPKLRITRGQETCGSGALGDGNDFELKKSPKHQTPYSKPVLVAANHLLKMHVPTMIQKAFYQQAIHRGWLWEQLPSSLSPTPYPTRCTSRMHSQAKPLGAGCHAHRNLQLQICCWHLEKAVRDLQGCQALTWRTDRSCRSFDFRRWALGFCRVRRLG